MGESSDATSATSGATYEHCYHRLRRARRRLNELAEDGHAYLDSDPATWELRESDDRGVVLVTCKIADDVPADLWLTASELMHHLRASLDHLVYQLAIASGSQPDEAKTQFPIFLKANDYWAGRGRRPSRRDEMLEGLAPKHQRRIDGLQPFQSGRTASRTALARLAAFSNRDKHRDPHTAAIVIFGFTVRLWRRGVLLTERYVPYAGDPHLLETDDPRLMQIRVRIAPSRGPADIQAELVNVKVGIGFGPELLQVADLEWTLDQVEKVVQRLIPS